MDSGFDRLPPHDIDAEMALLGSMCVGGAECIPQVLRVVENPEAFFRATHRTIFEVLLDLWGDGIPIDLVCVMHELKARKKLKEIGGEDYLVRLADSVPSWVNAEYYADIVAKAFSRRCLIQAGTRLVGLAYDAQNDVSGILSDHQRQLERATGRAPEVTDAAEIGARVLADVDAGEAAERRMLTGYKLLTSATGGGLGLGELTVLAGRPSHGKTTLALNLARNAVRQGLPTVVFTLEMRTRSVWWNLCAAIARRDANALRQGVNPESQREAVTGAIAALKDKGLHLVQSCRVSRRIVAETIRLKNVAAVKLVLIDYLNIVGDARARRDLNRVQAIGEVVKQFQSLAKENELAVVLLAQLSRRPESRPDKAPLLSDLRDSGEIEQDADVVMFVHRPYLYSHKPDDFQRLVVEVAKNRLGAVETFELRFNPPQFRIDPWEQEDDDHLPF